MKKIISASLVLMCIVLGCLKTSASEDAVPIKFIYINGSNTNTEKAKTDFTKSIQNAHPYFRAEFMTSPFIRRMLLNGQTYNITENPDVFFWGYDSQDCLADVNEELNYLKFISPKLAQNIRSLIAHYLHDAIWVQKEHNMQKIIDDLHKDVMAAYEKGEKTILFGYSAGSFITTRYLFHKIPAVRTEELIAKLEVNDDGTIDPFYRIHPAKPTCIDAISESKLGVYSSKGEIIGNQSPNLKKEIYLKLDEFTKTACTPNGEIIGIVNYASPVALFYSDLHSPQLEINKYNMNLYRYLKDNNMFLLTVNFSNDPLGYPLSKNLTAKEIEEESNIGWSKEGRGFFYNKSNVKIFASCLSAHTSYWTHIKTFAKAVADAYEEGYINFYLQ